MNNLNQAIIAFYQGAENREQVHIAKITKLLMENKKLKEENQRLRGERDVKVRCNH